MAGDRYDIILFGATSFVGKILSRYLAETYGRDLNWAAAARSQSKLDTLRRELGTDWLPTLTADANDPASLQALCAHTRVVVSTVGPYALYGEPLLRACVEQGTDYCDLTGEVQWVARMIARYDEQAKTSGARIIHCSGFDSIPSDLGVHFLQQQAHAAFGQYCQRVRMCVWDARGGASGGTVASLMNAVKEAAADPAVRRQMADPFALCPPAERARPAQPDVRFAQRDTDFDTWVGPFVMAAVNTRVVHRSHALQDQSWGENFVYDEAWATGSGAKGMLRAAMLSLGLAAVMTMAAFGPTRRLLTRLFPAPGEGPSPDEQQKGYYDLRFVGQTGDGQMFRTRVYGDRDPGYGSTAKMLGEAACCLAFETPKSDYAGGFWTPASLLGDRLLARLQQRAGLRFEIIGEH